MEQEYPYLRIGTAYYKIVQKPPASVDRMTRLLPGPEANMIILNCLANVDWSIETLKILNNIDANEPYKGYNNVNDYLNAQQMFALRLQIKCAAPKERGPGNWAVNRFFHRQHTTYFINVYLFKGIAAKGCFLSVVRSKFVFLLPQKPPPDTSVANLPFAPDGCKRGKLKND